MGSFTRPQRKADVPKARPTRNQLGLTVSGLELVNTDLDPTGKKDSIKKHPIFNGKRGLYWHWRVVLDTAMRVSINCDKIKPFINPLLV